MKQDGRHNADAKTGNKLARGWRERPRRPGGRERPAGAGTASRQPGTAEPGAGWTRSDQGPEAGNVFADFFAVPAWTSTWAHGLLQLARCAAGAANERRT